MPAVGESKVRGSPQSSSSARRALRNVLMKLGHCLIQLLGFKGQFRGTWAALDADRLAINNVNKV